MIRDVASAVAVAGLLVSATLLAAAVPDNLPLGPDRGAVQPAAPPPPPPPPPPLPTCERPEHRQFDYWLGDWEVRPNGTPATAPTPLANEIRLEDGGCVVTEHWTTPRMSGRSLNIYDRTRGQWHQTWVDSTGGLHEYWGNPDAEGNMVYRGSVPAAAGNGRQTVRLTFFNLGPDKARPQTVRQFSEGLGDDGRWTTGYDLIYSRRAATPAP
ncbi:MAG TPA: hypothetical protein VMW48_02765 [Vicinamibacterales bacterium]|nr:hypothetical protein [Vicinamibacterales bacterium]